MSVRASVDDRVALQIMARYKLGELPVLEDNGRLVGVIRAADAVELVQASATEDMCRIANLGADRIQGLLIVARFLKSVE